MHDPTNDTEATPHDFESLPIDEYAAAKADRERKQKQRMDAAHEKAARERGTCGVRMPDFFNGVATFCGRPSGHDDDCHPVPLAGDRKEGERDDED